MIDADLRDNKARVTGADESAVYVKSIHSLVPDGVSV
jgi:hypothetical protein